MGNNKRPGTAQRQPRSDTYQGRGPARPRQGGTYNGYAAYNGGYDRGADRRSDPRYAGRGGYDPRYAGRGGYDPRYAGRGGYDPRYAGRESYDPRYAGRGGYDPRYAGRGGYDPGADRRSGYNRRPTEEELLRQRQLREERRRRMEAERRRREEYERKMREERKIRRKRQQKVFAARAVVSLVVFCFMAVTLAAVMAIVFFSKPDAVTGSVKYFYAGSEIRTVSSDTAYRNDRAYICFNDLADYLKLSVIGDAESMKFVFPTEESAETGSDGSGREDYVGFFSDSRTVELNAERVTLPAETYQYGELVWVATEFIDEYIEGIDVECKDGKISVARVADPNVTPAEGEEPVYLEVALKLKDHGAVTSPSGQDTTPDAGNVTPEFSTDLSAYEEYMDPENADEYLILVNFENTVDSTLAPTDLGEVKNTRQDGRETQLLRLAAAKSLEALFIEMNAAGYPDVSVMSGYRSYESQSNLHESYIWDEMAKNGSLTYEAARQIVLTYSAAPGTSEHQTGLCVDMHNLPSADTAFASQPDYTWLCENAWKFGYILRYPENKTDITKISFEPWHWRFVGRAHAKAMFDGGLTLEEYVAARGEDTVS